MRPNDKNAPFKAGLHAERIQWTKIVAERLPARSIPQDIRRYIRDFGHLPYKVKRGDYMIGGRFNLEVEVKCRSFKRSSIGLFFEMDPEQIVRHHYMQKLTGNPVLFSIFRRKYDHAMEDEYYLITLESMMRETGVSSDKFPAHCPPFVSVALDSCITGLFFFDSIIAVILDLKIIKDVLNSFLL